MFGTRWNQRCGGKLQPDGRRPFDDLGACPSFTRQVFRHAGESQLLCRAQRRSSAGPQTSLRRLLLPPPSPAVCPDGAHLQTPMLAPMLTPQLCGGLSCSCDDASDQNLPPPTSGPSPPPVGLPTVRNPTLTTKTRIPTTRLTLQRIKDDAEAGGRQRRRRARLSILDLHTVLRQPARFCFSKNLHRVG